MRGIKITPADRALSLQVRARDGWTCQKCGQKFTPPTSGLHAAHMFGRRCGNCTAKRPRGMPVPEHDCTRMDPDNLLSLCYGCHTYADEHPIYKEQLFRIALGPERFEALAARAHQRRDRVA